MNSRSLFIIVLASSMIGAMLSAAIVLTYVQNNQSYNYSSISNRQDQLVSNVSYSDTAFAIPQGLNFVSAANKVTQSVVHIRSVYSGGASSFNALEGFFRGPAQSSGSGVILTDDGFIVTNNHVIDDASEIEVVLQDNRSYFGKLVGKDPTTDLALIKIEETNLPYLSYGNSDNIKTGEWVLAVGNPFDLNSTVTAGIVSAKARNIGILRDRNNLQIESFIQTDAAVNPGNSGGALVNLKGELVGINTAIATPNGSYAGYSFAVPVTLVKKVMDDLLEYGEVQRGLLGIRIGDVTARLAEARGLDVVNGVFVSYVNENSSAEEAGIEQGDVIVGINEMEVTNVSELQELVARNRPGDEVKVTYIRGGERKSVKAILRNTSGTTDLISKTYNPELGGAVFEELNNDEMASLQLNGGVKATEVNDGKWKESGLKEGFIITKIDKVDIVDLADLHLVLENKKGGILVEGITPTGDPGVLGVDW
ncbi:trypsin-like peptidase domain-containing protein [Fulvivirga lutea]|uniref:Trypsin-like peptidase domain-containing protein n=1 Tax=Fulvivirga lutea TaxID=2810512 RepID=A0A974WGT5_9BACT|nr:trypsin-like peptidase domain-containing protein [Fulvivirga lutea]QSE97418.1 trypsin-like peptidase domain-containing protein [Fulvivirga lutea]